jgi:hypothetical protein
MWTRRQVAVGGALTLLFTGRSNCCSANSRAPHSVGCLLADADFDRIYPPNTATVLYIKGDEPIIYKSGDRDFDFALAQTLAKLSDKFEVLPGFAYYDDTGSQNAYATDKVRLTGAAGTVLMGTNMLHRLRASPEYPEVAVATVCSHEFGHILQFKYGLFEKLSVGQPNGKRSELQADYFAGYFAGLRRRERVSYPAAVARTTIFNFGTQDFNNSDFHGTPEERGAAVVRGFEASFQENKNLNDAIQESLAYVLRL